MNSFYFSSVGSTYSCFTGFESVSTDGCKSRVEDDDGNIIQAASKDSDTDFCVSQLDYGKAKQGKLEHVVVRM